VRGIDLGTLQESVMYNGTGTTGTVSIGTIQACGALSEYIEYIIDGIPYTWVDLGQPNILFTMDSLPTNGYAARTTILGQFVTNGNMETTHFSFYNNLVPGTYPMVADPYQIKISNPAETIPRLEIIVAPNPIINITGFGPVGTGYIEGNFNLQVKQEQTNLIQNVICHFKVKR
jgi:hypothetical protein